MLQATLRSAFCFARGDSEVLVLSPLAKLEDQNIHMGALLLDTASIEILAKLVVRILLALIQNWQDTT